MVRREDSGDYSPTRLANDHPPHSQGLDVPAEIDGNKCEDYWRSHQVPMGDMDKAGHVEILEQWMNSYRPEELFNAAGKLMLRLRNLPERAATHER